MNEDDLRRALSAIAGEAAPPAPTAAATVTSMAAHRARRRRLAASGLGVAALVGGVLGVVGLLRDDGSSQVDTRPLQSTTTTSTTPPAPTTAVAVTNHGAVVVVDTTDGRTIRTLAPADSADATRKPARTPDGTTVYFSNRAVDCGSSDLFEVPADGTRPPRKVTQGHAPSVSPDGTRLAYATADGCVGASLVVRDLATGAEQTWKVPPRRPPHPFELGGISAVEWAPDNQRLAFQMDLDAVFVLDTRIPALLTTAKQVEPRQQPEDTTLISPAWNPDGRLAVVAACCRNPDGMTAEEARTTTRTFLVNIDTNQATPLLEPGEPVWSLDYDASGQWLVWVDADADSSLAVRTPDGETRHLGRGFGAVGW